MALDTISIRSNSEIRQLAKESLKGRWGLPIGVSIVMGLIMAAANSISILALIIGGSINLGLALFFLKWIRGEEPPFDDCFKGFENFGNALGLFLLSGLFVALWSLLFVIPGIIKALAYSQAFFIMTDYPELGALESITLSRRMMNGAKGKYFAMIFGFAMLSLLAFMFTLGIGMIWLVPFFRTCLAQFYQDLKENYTEDNQI